LRSTLDDLEMDRAPGSGVIMMTLPHTLDCAGERSRALLWLDGPGASFKALMAELHRSLLVAAAADGVSLDMAAGLFGRRLGLSICDEVLRSSPVRGRAHDHASEAEERFWRARVAFEGLPLFEDPVRFQIADKAMFEAFNQRLDDILAAVKTGREGHA
jgi:hypothetical protein